MISLKSFRETEQMLGRVVRDGCTCLQKLAHRQRSEKATGRSASATSVIAPSKFFDWVHLSAKILVQWMRLPKGDPRMIMLDIGRELD